MSDGIGSKVKMRNAFRYLKLTAALALILNFGLFFNRLLRHFIFPNLQIWKQARDIWVFVEKLEDRRLCVSQLSRRDTGGIQRSVKITFHSKVLSALVDIWNIWENWNIPKNIFQIIAPKCFFLIKGSTMDWCAKRISLARMFSYLGRTCHHTGLCQGGAGKRFWWQEFSLIISKSFPKKEVCCQVGCKWASSIFRWDRLSSFNRGKEVDFTWLVVEKN